jgi:hypothetical protein
VRLSNPSAGAYLGTPSVATVRIESNDSGFSFSGGSSYSFFEFDGNLSLAVNRGSDLTVEASVEYAIEPVSVTPDLDYTFVSGRLVFTAESDHATIEVPILNDGLKETTESFRVVLRNPSPGTSLGAPSIATVRILDNDPGFNFSDFRYFIAEGHQVSISVYRGTDPVGEASVDYSVEADSATAGLDFTPVSGRLTFLDQENHKAIQIPISNDTLQETEETFRVILSNPSPGSALGSPATVTVRITDNDPGFHFDWPTHSVIETGREVGLLVWRGSDATNEAHVTLPWSRTVPALNSITSPSAELSFLLPRKLPKPFMCPFRTT